VKIGHCGEAIFRREEVGRMGIEIHLSEKVFKEVEKVSRSEDALPEEMIVGRAVIEFLKLKDPETKAEIHENLSEKYMKDAEEFMKKGDYVQASEKAWGAASQMVKAVAAKNGLELRSHGELHKFVSKISKDRGDEEIRRLWRSAIVLHQNFYENWLPEDMVIDSIGDVRKLINKLRTNQQVENGSGGESEEEEYK